MEGRNVSGQRVRELCLRLKPILGEKMEHIFAAYAAEDVEGKKQIESYLELLATKYVPQKLEQAEPDLLPPTQEQAAGTYPLGQVQYAGRELYPFGLREEEWIQHLAVLGRSGAGKTNTGFVILNELKRHGKPFLVFDWKRNYRDLVSLPPFADVEVYTIGRNIAPFTFNPLIPPPGTSPKTWLKKLNEVIAHSYCLGNGVLYLLQQSINAVYEEAGVYSGKVQRWPTFRDVLAKARNMDVRGREAGWLSSTLRALSSLCFGDMDGLLNTGNNQNLDRILDSSVILELDALTQSDKVFFVQALLLWVHHRRMTDSRREHYKHTIVIEEAHHVLSDERRSLVGGQSVMEIIFREIREFGECLILLDQHPSRISLPALGNTYCTICHNLKTRADINAIAQCLLLDQEKDLLGSLGVGQAVVKLQGRIARPFQIQVPEFPIEKGIITDAYIQQHMQAIAPRMVMPEVSPDQEALPLSLPEHPIPDLSIAFLQDIQSYPDSGVAQRYKRLSLSVRQGQNLKDHTIREGLISEQLTTTARGRMRVLEVTEKGRVWLSHQAA